MGGEIISESGGGIIPLQGGAIIPELGGGFLRNQHTIAGWPAGRVCNGVAHQHFPRREVSGRRIQGSPLHTYRRFAGP